MKPALKGAYLALAIASLTACVDDTEQFTLGEPSLSILATGGCGRNSAPVLEEAEGSVTVTVTARDPRTPTGNLRTGTTVRLSFADEADLATAAFKSSELSTELITHSGDLPFNGSQARDEVICYREGMVSIIATITEYALVGLDIDSVVANCFVLFFFCWGGGVRGHHGRQYGRSRASKAHGGSRRGRRRNSAERMKR